MAKKFDVNSLDKKGKKEYLKNLHDSQTKKEKRTTFVFVGFIVLLLAIAAFGIYFLTSTKNNSLPKELGEKIAVDPTNGRLHIDPGEPQATYTSNPPTSGPHYNSAGSGPIECKFYDKEVKDEGVIHNLEHGAVWITYKNNDAQLKKDLKQITLDNSKVLISYRPKNDSNIALAGWGRLLKLDSFEQTKIEQFIKLYKNGPDSPEPLAGCGTSCG